MAAGYRVGGGEGRACFQAAAGTIQDVVADGPALHSRGHLVLRGLEFWFRQQICAHTHHWPDTDQTENFYEISASFTRAAYLTESYSQL